ncbi:MAG: hypothetical protein WBA12_00555 [Catalinimonas sp.]
MLTVKLFTWMVALQTTFCGCRTDRRQGDFDSSTRCFTHQRVGRLEAPIRESSGLVVLNDTLLLTHGDSGGPSTLYVTNLTGEIRDRIELPIRNYDWEEVAQDARGRVYVGDIGNNFNNREQLTIYAVDLEARAVVDTIAFSYPDQKAFPPPVGEWNFDCEGFFAHGDSLYLFSKNRGKGPMKLYRLPQRGGTHVAELIDTHPLVGQVTAADLNPSATRFVLLSYGRVYLFGVTARRIDLSEPLACLRFPNGGQSEAIAFLNDTDFVISNERGTLYRWCWEPGQPAAADCPPER